MEYKGYIGHVEYDHDAEIFHGQVINTKDVITFQGKSVEELKEEFINSLDVYLDFCKQLGQEPEKPFSGRLVLRLPPEIHRNAYMAAKKSGLSLNKWITSCVDKGLDMHLSGSQ